MIIEEVFYTLNVISFMRTNLEIQRTHENYYPRNLLPTKPFTHETFYPRIALSWMRVTPQVLKVPEGFLSTAPLTHETYCPRNFAPTKLSTRETFYPRNLSPTELIPSEAYSLETCYVQGIYNIKDFEL